MDDLRWLLLLVGAVVVAAIYFSSRFENEDWVNERKQLAGKKTGGPDKKKRRKKTVSQPTSPVVGSNARIKKEPQMSGAKSGPATSPAADVLVPQERMREPVNVASESESAADSALSVPPGDEIIPAKNETAIIEEIITNESLDAASAGFSDIEDQITEVEIPAELAVVEAEIKIAEIAGEEELLQTEIPPGIEPLVLSVSVLAADEENFNGAEIKEALEAEGISYGAMQIFHFHDPAKTDVAEDDDAVFSVANILEPGFFDLSKLDETQTPGLMLFCQLPGPLAGEAALDVMLDKGRGLAVRLHGQMCDDKRNPFTSQAKTYYLDRIATFNRELVLARSQTPKN